MGLCNYASLFGKPKTGLHRVRLFGVAIFDVIGMLLIAFLLSYYYHLNFLLTLSFVFLVAELFHLLFCVNTSFVNNVMGIHFKN